MKLGRHNSDDSELLPVHSHGSAHDAGVGVELPCPQGGTDNGEWISSGFISVFVAREDAAQDRLDAQDVEVIAGNEFAPDTLGVIVLPHAERVGLGHGEARDQGQVIAVFAIIGVTGRDELAVCGYGFKAHQFAAVRDTGQRVQENRVDPTEYGGIGGDSDCESGDGDQRESRILKRYAQTVAKILEQRHACS